MRVIGKGGAYMFKKILSFINGFFKEDSFKEILIEEALPLEEFLKM